MQSLASLNQEALDSAQQFGVSLVEHNVSSGSLQSGIIADMFARRQSHLSAQEHFIGSKISRDHSEVGHQQWGESHHTVDNRLEEIHDIDPMKFRSKEENLQPAMEGQKQYGDAEKSLQEVAKDVTKQVVERAVTKTVNVNRLVDHALEKTDLSDDNKQVVKTAVTSKYGSAEERGNAVGNSQEQERNSVAVSEQGLSQTQQMSIIKDVFKHAGYYGMFKENKKEISQAVEFYNSPEFAQAEKMQQPTQSGQKTADTPEDLDQQRSQADEQAILSRALLSRKEHSELVNDFAIFASFAENQDLSAPSQTPVYTQNQQKQYGR